MKTYPNRVHMSPVPSVPLFRGKIRRMRTMLIVVALTAALSARRPRPRRSSFARVFPNAGQIGLFVAAADGSDERPLLDHARRRTTTRCGRPTARRSSSRRTATGRRICSA